MDKTVLYIGNFSLPDGNAAAQRVRANARLLVQAGYRVVCVGCSAHVAYGAPVNLTELDEAGIEYWSISLPGSIGEWFRKITSIGELEPFFTRPGSPIALVIAYDFPSLALLRLRTRAHRAGAKLVAESTEWYSSFRGFSPIGLVRELDCVARMRYSNRRADGLIVASDFLAQTYADTGRPVLVLPTLMPDRVDPALIDAAKAGRAPGPARLVFSGTGFDPKIVLKLRDGLKDRLDQVIDMLQAAAAHGADFRLDIFGVEQADYLAIIPRHRAMLDDLGARIAFHGMRPRQEIIDHVLRADYTIFIRPDNRVSLAGFPTKYAESVHFGTPVITNPLGTLTRYHVDGQTGYYVDPDRIDESGRKLAEIFAAGPDRSRELSLACAKAGTFAPESFVAKARAFTRKVEGA